MVFGKRISVHQGESPAVLYLLLMLFTLEDDEPDEYW